MSATAVMPPSGENVAQPESSSAADSDDNAVLAPVAPVARRSRMKSVSVMASSYCSDLGVGVTRWFCS
ncbi:MAG: hypothetical protein ACK463_35570, partial [Bradyrhizobium sp.]